MAKQQNTIIWIIGIIILVILLAKVPLEFPFAIITKTVCISDTISYLGFEGNVYDSQNGNHGIDYNVNFVAGKIGSAAGFNTTNYIDFPSVPLGGNTIVMWIYDKTDAEPSWNFVANNGTENFVNGVIDSSISLFTIDSNFGLGFNGSVDEMAVFSRSFSASEIAELYNLPTAVCYTISGEENMTCKDYATDQVTDPGIGCLNYSGTFFPNCTYNWVSEDQWILEDNDCERSFYCQSGTYYLTNASCQGNLTYSCYLLINNVCITKTDYASCILNATVYDNSTACYAARTVTTTTPTTTTAPSGTIMDKLNKEVFKVGDFSITLLYLLIALAAVLGILYYYQKK